MELFSFIALFSLTLVFVFSQREHFVMVLLGLELLVLCVYMLMTRWLYVSESSVELNLCVVFLVVAVCDSVYGLSLLVCTARQRGYDQLKNLFCLMV